MDEDDLVSYRQYTINTTGTNRGGRKRPAPPASPPPRTTTNAFDQESDMNDDYTSINPKQQAIGDTTYTVMSQQSIIGLQQTEDILADMTDDEDEEN